MKKNILLLFIVSLPFAVFAQPYSAGKGLVYVYAGMTFANLNTSALFDVSPEVAQNYPSFSTTLDLEDDLGFPSNSNLFYVKALVGGRFQGVVSLFSLHRNGEALLTKSFAFGEHTYNVQARVKGYFDTDYYSGTIRYSIVKNPLATAGLSLGFRYLRFNAGIHADSLGVVFDESGSFDVPVAVPGIHGSIYALNNTLVRGSLEYISLKLGDTKGTVLEAQLSVEYYLLRYLGIGVGYSITHLEAEGLPDNPIFLKNIDYKVDGLQAFAAFRF
jgi:hypothetical protein